MDAALVASVAGMASASFLGSFVVVGTGGSRSHERLSMMADELAGRIREIPTVRSLELAARSRELRSSCLSELPTMLDVVNLGLSAGLSFDASLELYCDNYETELSSEFGGALLSWRVGAVGRGDALLGLAERLDLAALRTFSTSVVQALEFGSPLAEVLERQSEVIREEQRSQVEEEIEKVPVRMLIPLGTLIVPAMLVAILGPLVSGSAAIG